MLTVRALPAQFVKVANAICGILPIPHCGGYLPHVIKKQNSVRIMNQTTTNQNSINMKKYIGTKEIMAEPMNECVAVEKGFARPNTDNHEWRLGYHVQYTNPDGSTYDSWSPKEVFEQSYQVADTYLDRMHTELKELTDKLDKLFKFFPTDTYNSLPELEKQLLQAQYGAMLSYDNILAARICVVEGKNHKSAKSE